VKAVDSPSADLTFLTGGGAMGERMRLHDWSASPLGQPADWPQSLRTAVSLMLNSGHPMFIAWGPDLGFLYNEGYRELLGAKDQMALGARFEDIWTEIWPEILPLVECALSGQPTWHEDLPLEVQRHGFPEKVWFTFSYSPVRDESGGIGGMFCAVQETTATVLARRRLQESERTLKAERDRLYGLFEEAPSFVAIVEGPEHVFRLANRSYLQLIGFRHVVGSTVQEALPELAGQGFLELLDHVYGTGEAHVGQGTAVLLRRTPDAEPEERFVDFIFQPIRERDGAISGIFIIGSDVTERTLYMAQQKMLLDELNHRVKNNLATVQSIAYQTARHAPDLQSFRKTFDARLIALARTHDVLTATAWDSADLRLLLEAELGPYGESRFTLEGPTVRLTPAHALTFGLVAHELATNAAKYGALSQENGCVSVRWARTGDSPPLLRIDWTERQGPPVTPAETMGFGSRLIARGVAEIGGEIFKDWRPEGMTCRIVVPL
jgi:two-component sensor histidine kinase